MRFILTVVTFILLIPFLILGMLLAHISFGIRGGTKTYNIIVDWAIGKKKEK